MYEYLKRLWRKTFPKDIEPVSSAKVFIDIANGETTNALTQKVRDGELDLEEISLAREFKWSGEKGNNFLDEKVKRGITTYSRLQRIANYVID